MALVAEMCIRTRGALPKRVARLFPVKPVLPAHLLLTRSAAGRSSRFRRNVSDFVGSSKFPALCTRYAARLVRGACGAAHLELPIHCALASHWLHCRTTRNYFLIHATASGDARAHTLHNMRALIISRA